MLIEQLKPPESLCRLLLLLVRMNCVLLSTVLLMLTQPVTPRVWPRLKLWMPKRLLHWTLASNLPLPKASNPLALRPMISRKLWPLVLRSPHSRTSSPGMSRCGSSCRIVVGALRLFSPRLSLSRPRGTFETWVRFIPGHRLLMRLFHTEPVTFRIWHPNLGLHP